MKMHITRWLIVALLFVSCSSIERAVTPFPEKVDPATAEVSQEEAVDIATVVLASRRFADDYQSEPSRVGQFGRAWEVFFPLREAKRLPHEIAIHVDMMTGEVMWSYLE